MTAATRHLVVLLVVGQCSASASAHEKWTSQRLAELPADKLVREIVHRGDEDGAVAEQLIQAVANRGGACIVEAVKHLDELQIKRTVILFEVIARAGRCRRVPAELLRHYDPDAYWLSYEDEGKAVQSQIVAALDWPANKSADSRMMRSLPQAAVRAAPAATLDWLSRQAVAETPGIQQLTLVLKTWSRWIAQRHERMYVRRLLETLVSISKNQQIRGAEAAVQAMLQCISATSEIRLAGPGEIEPAAAFSLSAETKRRLVDFAASCTLHASGSVRGTAYRALAALGGDDALTAIESNWRDETDVAVLTSIAQSLGGFPASGRADEIAQAMFLRHSESSLRRRILFSALGSHWPGRDELVLQALKSSDGGLIAVALQLVESSGSPSDSNGSEKSPPLQQPIRGQLLKLASLYKSAPPALVDALGHLGGAGAVEFIKPWLAKEKNSAFRVKMVLALQRIGGREAAAAIAELIEREADETVMVFAVRAAGQMKIADTAATVIALAESIEIPLAVRAEAIWTLGQLATVDTRAALNRLASKSNTSFSATSEESADEDLLDQARLYVHLARMAAREMDAEAEVVRLYRLGTPLMRMTALVALADLGHDVPMIEKALDSSDFAVLLAAVRAAGKVAPQKYREKLVALRDSPWMRELLQTGMQDMDTLRHLLRRAIGAEKK